MEGRMESGSTPTGVDSRVMRVTRSLSVVALNSPRGWFGALKSPPSHAPALASSSTHFLSGAASKARCLALDHLIRGTECPRSFGARSLCAADMPAPQSSGDAA